MGNQTAKTPYEILPLDRYFTSIPAYSYETSLGSTRFLKVAKGKGQKENDYVVVKVFVIHDPSLSVRAYAAKIQEIYDKLTGALNCLPFQEHHISDKAGFLVRQYVKYNLHDRLSVRPFYTPIEKKWIAFQLFCALDQCCVHKVCHGDIKSENVLVTSWNWVLLTDFANFKPTFLPENNPSDFNYYFDTSRRRTCYIAPERFQSGARSTDPNVLDITDGTSDHSYGELTHAMDIFSLGCVLIELFTDGKVPFDLSQLLHYRKGEYSPWKIVDTIQDKNVKDLINSMIQKNPSHRLTSRDYLREQQGKAFPLYFDTYLRKFIQPYKDMKQTPDEKISLIRKDLPNIFKHCTDHDEISLLLASIVTSYLRDLKFCETKLLSLALLAEFSNHLDDSVVLDRIIPHIMHLVDDNMAMVKTDAIRVLTQVLRKIDSVPKSEANIFPDYILPHLAPLATHQSVHVRVALAENIAVLSDTATRLLEISQLDSNAVETQINYENELKILHDLIKQQVVNLLSDPNNSVKKAMLRHSIAKLAVIFGKRKASDVILSHMVTFLNDKRDWQLRQEFFDCMVGIVAYLGWSSTTFLQPLIEQGLSDNEVFAVKGALEALNQLLFLGLVHQPVVIKLLEHVVPLLCHPSDDLRYAAANCIITIAKKWSVADVLCSIQPLIKPFLSRNVLRLDNLEVLIYSLLDPIPRAVMDYLIKHQDLNDLFNCLEERILERNLVKKADHEPLYKTTEEQKQVLNRMKNLGFKPEQEDVLFAMKHLVNKLHHNHTKVIMEKHYSTREDLFDLKSMRTQQGRFTVMRRHADLNKPGNTRKDLTTRSNPTLPERDQAAIQAENWRQAFQGSEIDISRPPPPVTADLRQPVQLPELMRRPMSPSRATEVSNQESERRTFIKPGPAVEMRYCRCKLDLRTFVYHKRDEHEEETKEKELVERCQLCHVRIPTEWKPRGHLLSHIHEHSDAITRILVSPTNGYFLTCSKDGTVRLFDTYRSDGVLPITIRSKAMYSFKQGDQVVDMVYCGQTESVAVLTSSNYIHILTIDFNPASANIILQETINTRPHDHGNVVAIAINEFGSHKELIYATVHSTLIGVDLEEKRELWELHNDLAKGLITSIITHPKEKWLAVGTSRGKITLYDMRFRLPVNTIHHPQGYRVTRMLVDPEQSCIVVAAYAANNEVSVWNMETLNREEMFWASKAQVFSTQECTTHHANGMFIYSNKEHQRKKFLLTAGTDMKMRYWDCLDPADSLRVSQSAVDMEEPISATFSQRLVEGTVCFTEKIERSPMGRADLHHGRTHPGHHNVITDLAIYQTTEPFIVTASAHGIIKIWK